MFVSEPSPPESRRHRTAFTDSQLQSLITEYNQNPYISRTRRMELGEAIGLNDNAIKVRRFIYQTIVNVSRSGTNRYSDIVMANPRMQSNQ